MRTARLDKLRLGPDRPKSAESAAAPVPSRRRLEAEEGSNVPSSASHGRAYPPPLLIGRARLANAIVDRALARSPLCGRYRYRSTKPAACLSMSEANGPAHCKTQEAAIRNRMTASSSTAHR